MKKFLFVLTTVFLLFILSFTYANANSSISVYLNGNELNFDTEPIVVDGRTLVPFRGILEKLGATVNYEDGIATASTNGKFIMISPQENKITINACTLETDVPPQIINGRTMVPLRLISECLGACVEWDDKTQTVSIQTVKETYMDWNDSYYYWGDVTLEDGNTIAAGYGTIYNKEDNTFKIRGYFENNFVIEGMIKFSDSEYYIGEFSKTENGTIKGKGTLYRSNGSYISAIWENNKTNGLFYYYDADSNTEVFGNAVNNLWNGEVTFHSLTTGATSTEIYENGVRISPSNNQNNSPNPYNGSAITHASFYSAKYPLYLYSNDGNVFLGKLSTNKFDSDSISNTFGRYGSNYSSTSIFNSYGTYGSKFSTESAFNEFASRPPKIVDSNGTFIAYLTENKYKSNSISYTELISILNKFYQ